MTEIVVNKKIFNKRFLKLYNKSQRIQIAFGGSSSGKSYNIFQMVPFWLIEGRNILAIRENETHVRKSIFLEITKAISRLNLSDCFVINKTEKTIKCLISNGSCSMVGVNDPEKLKSITPVTGSVFDTVIIEEATELSPEQYNQILLRQRGVTEFPIRCMLLFNPINKNHWIYNRYFKDISSTHDFNSGRECLEYESDKLYIHKSTYLDNPHVGEEALQTYEEMREVAPEVWNIYAQGNFGVFGDRIFNYTAVDSYSDDVWRLPWKVGFDHGFHDYETCTISKYDKVNKKIYHVESIAMREVDPEIFANKVKEMFSRHRIDQRSLMYGDSSDPRMNTILKRLGFANLKKVKKGDGSKFSGLMWLKMHQLYVLKSQNEFIDSLNVYIWKKDKNGNNTDDTVHDGSDRIDALRYSYESEFIGRGNTVYQSTRRN